MRTSRETVSKCITVLVVVTTILFLQGTLAFALAVKDSEGRPIEGEPASSAILLEGITPLVSIPEDAIPEEQSEIGGPMAFQTSVSSQLGDLPVTIAFPSEEAYAKFRAKTRGAVDLSKIQFAMFTDAATSRDAFADKPVIDLIKEKKGGVCGGLVTGILTIDENEGLSEGNLFGAIIGGGVYAQGSNGNAWIRNCPFVPPPTGCDHNRMCYRDAYRYHTCYNAYLIDFWLFNWHIQLGRTCKCCGVNRGCADKWSVGVPVE